MRHSLTYTKEKEETCRMTLCHWHRDCFSAVIWNRWKRQCRPLWHQNKCRPWTETVLDGSVHFNSALTWGTPWSSGFTQILQYVSLRRVHFSTLHLLCSNQWSRERSINSTSKSKVEWMDWGSGCLASCFQTAPFCVRIINAVRPLASNAKEDISLQMDRNATAAMGEEILLPVVFLLSSLLKYAYWTLSKTNTGQTEGGMPQTVSESLCIHIWKMLAIFC